MLAKLEQLEDREDGVLNDKEQERKKDQSLKELGNTAFKNQEYEQAIAYYTDALQDPNSMEKEVGVNIFYCILKKVEIVWKSFCLLLSIGKVSAFTK